MRLFRRRVRLFRLLSVVLGLILIWMFIRWLGLRLCERLRLLRVILRIMLLMWWWGWWLVGWCLGGVRWLMLRRMGCGLLRLLLILGLGLVLRRCGGCLSGVGLLRMLKALLVVVLGRCRLSRWFGLRVVKRLLAFCWVGRLWLCRLRWVRCCEWGRAGEWVV